jgi:protein ImuB
MKRILCVWLPHWPLQRFATARPELAGRAVLLYEASPQGGLKIVGYAPSLGGGFDDGPLASGVGSPRRVVRHRQIVQPGIPLAEAIALIGASDTENLQIEVHDPWADELALRELADWCQQFSPTVGVEQAERPDTLLLDVTGSARTFGGEASLLRQLQAAFAGRGLQVRLAIADTIGAAWALSHYHHEAMFLTPCRLRATLLSIRKDRKNHGDTEGTEKERPPEISQMDTDEEAGLRNSSLHLCPSVSSVEISGSPSSPCPPRPRGSIPVTSYLADLSVEALRLPAETLHWLAQLGLQRIGQLAILPRPALTSRFGPGLLKRLDQALGTAEEVIVSQKPPLEWTADWLLEYPTDRREAIEIILRRLLVRLIAALGNSCRGITQIQCRLQGEQAATVHFSLRLFQPSALVDHLWELIVLRLETQRLKEPVVSVHLSIAETAPLGEQQQQLFEGETSASPRELAMLVDRLSSRLGRQAVLKGRVLPDAQPEFAGHYQPLQQPADKRRPLRKPAGKLNKSAESNPAAAWTSGERPLAISAKPVELKVWSREDGLPLGFRYAGRDHRIAAAWGPERIETGWWRSRCVRRDYYQVETTTGSRFWLFRQLTADRWFLHGTFD